MEATSTRRSLFDGIQTLRALSSTGLTKRLFILAVSLLPSLGPILLIRFLGARVLVYDEWGLTYLFQKLSDGDLNLPLIWSGNHEHRLVFPRLLFCLVAAATRWDPRVVMDTSVAVTVVAWTAFVWNFTNRFRYSGAPSILTIGLSSLIFFSLSQEENWLWAFQFPFFLIVACQVLALAIVMNGRLSLSTRMVSAAVLCSIASFSSAQGLFSWIALLPVILAVCTRRRSGWLAVVGWLSITTIVWIIYLNGLDLSQSGGLRVLLAQPLPVLRLGLVLLANPFIGDVPLQSRFVVAYIVGSVIVLSTIVVFLTLVRKLGWRGASPLLSLSLIGLLPWAALSTGRLRDVAWIFDVSRYTTPVIPITIALILGFWVLQDNNPLAASDGQRNATVSSRLLAPATAKWLFIFVSVLFFLGYLWNLPYSIHRAAAESERRQIADRFNTFSEYLHEKIEGNLDPTPESESFGIRLLGLNSKSGMRQLAVGGYRSLVQNALFLEDPADAVGQIDDANQSGGTSAPAAGVSLSGSCKIFSKDRFEPFVLATNRNDSRIIGAEYVPALRRPRLSQKVPWKLVVSRSLCTTQGESITLDTWVYDRTKNTFYLIGQKTLPDSQ